MYIACPKCDWRPQAHHRWTCTCGHAWHIFDTEGVCPACEREWTHTRCFSFLGCGEWSDHIDWYHHQDTRTVEDFLIWDRRERRARAQDTAHDSGEDTAHGSE